MQRLQEVKHGYMDGVFDHPISFQGRDMQDILAGHLLKTLKIGGVFDHFYFVDPISLLRVEGQVK